MDRGSARQALVASMSAAPLEQISLISSDEESEATPQAAARAKRSAAARSAPSSPPPSRKARKTDAGRAAAPSRKARKDPAAPNAEDPPAAAAARPAPSASQRASYLQAREAKLKACRFNLSALPAGKRVHDTSRTIKKPTPAWAGFWPPLRELMQNTIDHLDLAPRGRLNSALSLRVERPAGQRGTLASIAFRCGDEPVCAIEVEEDELRILQHYTFPLHPRALETGVPDAGKGGDATAGGFGDGFKTAAAALLGQPACRSISWTFETAEGRTVRWDFVGAERAAVGNFRASRVLEVHVLPTPRRPARRRARAARPT